MPEPSQPWTCHIPPLRHKTVLLGHGSGGKLMHQLIDTVFRPLLLPEDLAALDDAALLNINGARLAFTTDAFVVDPIVFPGGDIGKLSINGTINDLAVSGAQPLCLSAAFILEEGLNMETLYAMVASMREAAEAAGVPVVTGDTKVVNRGKADKLFITTTGIGLITYPHELSVNQARPGDVVILNGPIAAHGVAILMAREEIEFEHPVLSDTAALHTLVAEMLRVSPRIRCMRDATRGGLASALNEIASSSGVGIVIYEEQIPIQDEVKGACEILGLDPLHVANEGKLVAIVAREEAEKVLACMKNHPLGREASIIGEVKEDPRHLVLLKTQIGGLRVVSMLSGEQLPRIC